MNLAEKIKNGWEISAEGYSKRIVKNDFISPGRDVWTKLILEKAPREGKLKILDVGTGPGVFATILAMAGHETVGIDISPKMLEQARENSAKYGVSPEYIVMNSQEMDFAESTFDMIVSRNVVWATEYPALVYDNWLRILKPGGRVIVFDGGHAKDDFLTKFDHNTNEYSEDFKAKFGHAPALSFDKDQYEAARGWKRELPLTHEARPDWDIEAMVRLGYTGVCWEDVAERAYYTPEQKFSNHGKVFFRLCGDKQ